MSSHLIEDMVFDIAFEAGDTELAGDDYLNSLLRESLLPVVDEVLDQHDDVNAVTTFDTLELDLGEIPSDDFAREVGLRLRAALEDALKRQRITAPKRTRRSQLREETEAEQLSGFLRSGRLPWPVDSGDVRVHEAALERLLAGPAEALLQVLAAAIAEPRSARRLVRQFPEPQLLAILRKAAPTQAERLLRLITELGALAQRHRAGKAAAAREVIWRGVLAAVLKRPSEAGLRTPPASGFAEAEQSAVLAAGVTDVDKPVPQAREFTELEQPVPQAPGVTEVEQPALQERKVTEVEPLALQTRGVTETEQSAASANGFTEAGLPALLASVVGELAALAGARAPEVLAALAQDAAALGGWQSDAHLASPPSADADTPRHEGASPSLLADAGGPVHVQSGLSLHANADTPSRLDAGLSLRAQADAPLHAGAAPPQHADAEPRAGADAVPPQRADMLPADASIPARAVPGGRRQADPARDNEPVDAGPLDYAPAYQGHAGAPGETGMSTAWSATLRNRVVKALLGGDAAALDEDWPFLVRDHASLLRKALRHYGHYPAVREMLALRLPEAMFVELLDLLDPRAGMLLAVPLAGAVRFQAAAGLADPAAWTAWKQRLRQAAVEAMLAGAPPRFDLLADGGALLQRLAGQDPARYVVLLDAWIDALPAAERYDEVAAALESLQQAALRSRRSVSVERSALIVQAYDLADTLRRQLEQPGDGNGDAAAGLAAALAAHPRRLLELADQLGVAQGPLLRLVRALATGSARASLLAAIEAAVADAADRVWFLRTVIGVLADCEALDLDAILEQDARLHGAADVPAMSAMTREPVPLPAPVRATDLRALVEQYLGAANAEHVPSLLESIEAMAVDAADKPWYLQAVSTALAARGQLDLDAILTQDAARQADGQGAEPGPGTQAGEQARLPAGASDPGGVAEEQAHLHANAPDSDAAAKEHAHLRVKVSTAEQARLHADPSGPDAAADEQVRLHADAPGPDAVAAEQARLHAGPSGPDAAAEEQAHLRADASDPDAAAEKEARLRAEAPAPNAAIKEGAQLRAGTSGLNVAAEEQARARADAFGLQAGAEQDSHPRAGATEPALEAVAGLDIAAWRQRIARALIGGDAQLISEHRQVLLTDHRSLLEDALRHYGRSEAVRQALVRGFPDVLLADLVELIEPRAALFAAAVRANPALLQEAFGDTGSSNRTIWRQRFWLQMLESSMAPQDGFDAALDIALDALAGENVGSDHFVQRWLATIQADAEPTTATGIEPAAAMSTAAPARPPAAPASLPADVMPAEATSAQESTADEQVLAAFLQADGMDAVDLPALARTLDEMAVNDRGALASVLAAALAAPASRARIVAALPDRLLTRMLRALLPAEHAAVQRIVDLVAAAYARVHPGAPGVRGGWDAVFAYLFEHRRQYTETALTGWLVADAGGGLGDVERTEFVRLVAGAAPEPQPEPQPQPRGHDEAAPTLREMDSESPEPLDQLFLANAGMVLAAPYLPRLFSVLALTEEGRFVDRAAAERAVHLLQFMVDTRTDAPEYQLVLNKLLCGVASGVPIIGAIEITEHERQTIEGLLQAMIANWKTIGSTSIDGLRETFLRRKGSMQLRDDAWQLQVQPGTFDMLLDRLPWSFSIIKYPWMERPVHVTWR